MGSTGKLSQGGTIKWDLDYNGNKSRVGSCRYPSLSVETKFWESRISCDGDRNDCCDAELARICQQLSQGCYGM